MKDENGSLVNMRSSSDLAYDTSGVEACVPRRKMILNPDHAIVAKITERINKCGGKCPCQKDDGTKDIMCPCSDFIAHNECHCKLFIYKD